jgi:hypothetical protein
MVAAFLAQRARRLGIALIDEVSLAAVVLCGQARHDSLLQLLGGGLRLLDPVWFLGAKLVCDAEAALRTVVAPPAVFGSARLPDFFDPASAGAEMDFLFATLLFGEALAAGSKGRLRAFGVGGLRLRRQPPRAAARPAGAVRLPGRGGAEASHCVRGGGGSARSTASARLCWPNVVWGVAAVLIKAAVEPSFSLLYCVCASSTWMGWHSPAGSAGRPQSESGRARDAAPWAGTRPRGPGLLYTVRRDLDGHGGLDVTGARDLGSHVGPDVLGDTSPLAPAARVGTRGGRAARARDPAGT